MEHCKQLSPMYQSGFTTLPQQIGGNPWMTLPQPIKQTKPWGGSNTGGEAEILSKLAELLLPRLRRNRRQAGGLLEADESDLQEFLGILRISRKACSPRSAT